MKYATIVGIIIFIVIVGIMMRGDNNSVVQTETEVATAVEETNPRIETQDEDPGETITSNDIGMEYPFPDEPIPTTVPGATVITVKGVDFAYDVKEIRVKKGDTVTLNFESEAGFHDWVVDEFSARTEKVRAGGKTSVTFVADKTGTFEYYCSVGSHRANGMVGNLIVE